MELNAKIYVAGHRGLVGSAIWTRLQDLGYTNLVGRSHQELDLCNYEAVEAFFEEVRPEYVFLAAAHVGGIMANNTYRADFLLNNLNIQNNVISLSHRYGVKKLLFLGSTCIYPKEAKQPMKEDELLTAPLEYTNEPYAIAKIAGLKLCESFNLQYGTNFISVMPTNLYGYNDNFDLERSHVLPAMIRKLHLAKALNEGDFELIRKDLAKRPISQIKDLEDVSDIRLAEILKEYYGIEQDCLKLWGSGRPMREFMWSEDMANACVFVMQKINFEDAKPSNSEVRNCHINIGTGKEISIKDLAELIARTIAYKGRLEFDRSKPDGTMRKLTDPSRLQEMGFRYEVELDEGVRRLYDWYLKS